MKRFLILIVLFTTLIKGTAPARAAPLEFSDQTLPFDKIFYVMWKPLWTSLPENIYRNFGQRIAPNGDTQFLDPSGNVAANVQVNSTVNANGTQRFVRFGFSEPSGGNFTIEIRTEGSDLVAPPIEQIRVGRLPFFPSGDNERFSEITITNTSGNYVGFRIFKETVGDTQFLTAIGCMADRQPILIYREESGPQYRQFIYELKKGLVGTDVTLGATKLKTEDMFVGTENFYVNGASVSYSVFQNHTEMFLVPFATNFISF